MQKQNMEMIVPFFSKLGRKIQITRHLVNSKSYLISQGQVMTLIMTELFFNLLPEYLIIVKLHPRTSQSQYNIRTPVIAFGECKQLKAEKTHSLEQRL